jgi:hypothetical protein
MTWPQEGEIPHVRTEELKTIIKYNINVCECVCVCVCVCARACARLCLRVHMCVHVFVYRHLYLRVLVCICVHLCAVSKFRFLIYYLFIETY